MKQRQTPLSPELYLLQIFSARAACEGGVVRRKLRDIDRIVGRETFLKELKRRGYTAVENAGQIVIFCNNEPVIPLIARRKSLPRIWFRPFLKGLNSVP